MDTPTKKYVWDLLSERFPENAVPALMASIDVETGGTFDYKQKQIGGGKGYGLLQFDFHRPYYKKWLASNKKQDSAEAQLDYLHDTLYGRNQDVIGKKTAKELRMAIDSQDPGTLTQTLTDNLLRPGKPNMEKRLEAINKYTTSFNPNAVTPTNEVQGTVDYLRKMFGF